MTLNRGSKLVRFAYYFADFGVPSQTSLCRFFWRAFVFMPLAWIGIVGIVCLLLFMLTMLTWSTKGVAPVAIVVIAFVVAYVAEHFTTIKNSTFIQGIKSLMEPYCPIIEIR